MIYIFLGVFNSLVNNLDFITVRVAIFLLDEVFKNTGLSKLLIKRLLFLLMQLHKFSCAVHLLECHMLPVIL
jgi:hypothetical protein